MVLLMAAYIAYLFISAKRDKDAMDAMTGEIDENEKSLVRSLAEFFGGLAALIIGARFFVSGAVCAAKLMHVPEAVIALTIVALGTSLPELAASLIATIKGETDIAVGNIIGSNIWNILCIMGISPIIKPIKLEHISNLDLTALLIISLLAIPICITGKKISRPEGIIWLVGYIAYVTLLIVK